MTRRSFIKLAVIAGLTPAIGSLSPMFSSHSRNVASSMSTADTVSRPSTMWDLALVTALSRPELAESGRFFTPPDNIQREIRVYTSVDSSEMKRDWWHRADEALAEPAGGG